MVQLTQQQIIDLQQAGRILHDLLPHLDGLEACGHDCKQLRLQNEQTQAQISAILAHFSPKPGVPQT